ncbi:MAG: hypothetical protein LBT97_03140 [Planctomycetota bacterium]|jgi:hypothetical protein|nr:hypothetical protein [Planctomycetota bacterium]
MEKYDHVSQADYAVTSVAVVGVNNYVYLNSISSTGRVLRKNVKDGVRRKVYHARDGVFKKVDLAAAMVRRATREKGEQA